MEKEALLEYKRKIALLSEKEKRKRDIELRKIALGEISGPTTGYPSIDKPWLKYYSESGITKSIPKMSMYQYFARSIQEYLNLTAIDLRMSFNNFKNPIRTLTYNEVLEEIVTIACGLKYYGFDENQILIEILPNLIESRESIYAANAVGTTVYPLSPMLPTKKFEEIASHKKVKNLVIFNGFYTKFDASIKNSNFDNILVLNGLESFNPALRSFALIKDKLSQESKFRIKKDSRIIIWEDIIKAGKAYRKRNGINTFADFRAHYDSEHVAVIVGTSGTTGMPKGACLTDNSLNACDFCERIPEPFKPGEKNLDILIQSISYGLGIMHHTMSGGLYNYVVPEMITDRIGELLKATQPDHFSGGPIHYENILKSKEYQNGSIKHPKNFLSGGATLVLSTEKELNGGIDENYIEPLTGETKVFVRQGLGATENTGTGIFTTRGSYKLGSVGIPIALSNCSIFEFGTDNELPIGEKGEICVHGETVMKEYFENPEETKKVLIKHSDGEVWLHLGDFGYMDKDGHVFILDRYKNIFMRNGFNVHPSKIEEVIKSSGIVEQCFVTGIEHPVEMFVPVAYIALKKEISEEEAIKEFNDLCYLNLDEYFMPYKYIFVNEIPLNLGGKVDKMALLAKYPVDFSDEKERKLLLR